LVIDISEQVFVRHEALTFPVASMAADGAGGASAADVLHEFGFVSRGDSTRLMFCAVDQFGGEWNLNATNGVITGTRDNIQDCVWSVSGSNVGPVFSMNLDLAAGGTNCCLTGFAEGIGDKPSKSAAGDVTWGSNCSGTFAYTWTAPCSQ
jgi:hypothetical protein